MSLRRLLMADNIYSTYHYYMKTKKEKEAVDEIAPKIINAAERAIVGNVGDIKYTVRTDIPYGGYWCDGQTIAKDQLEHIYQMLLDGRLQSVDMATYDEMVSSKGSCGFFGLDTDNKIFKVPTLTDVYIKSGQAAQTFGAESLPNFKYDVGYTGKQGNGNPDGSWDSGGAMYPRVSQYITIDPSTKNAAYQDGAKVNPDHVKYRAYIVLFSSEKELAIVNWTSQLNKLAEQLKKDLVAYGSATISYWD